MQRRATNRVAAVYERWVGIEKVADALDIAGLRSRMDRMIGVLFGRRNSSPAFARGIQKLRDGFMTPVSGHLDETAVVIAIPFRICAGFEKDPHRFEMPFAYGEVNRSGVPVFRMSQARSALDQTPKRGYVASRGGSDRVPDVSPAVRFKFRGVDHFTRAI